MNQNSLIFFQKKNAINVLRAKVERQIAVFSHSKKKRKQVKKKKVMHIMVKH